MSIFNLEDPMKYVAMAAIAMVAACETPGGGTPEGTVASALSFENVKVQIDRRAAECAAAQAAVQAAQADVERNPTDAKAQQRLDEARQLAEAACAPVVHALSGPIPENIYTLPYCVLHRCRFADLRLWLPDPRKWVELFEEIRVPLSVVKPTPDPWKPSPNPWAFAIRPDIISFEQQLALSRSYRDDLQARLDIADKHIEALEQQIEMTAGVTPR